MSAPPAEFVAQFWEHVTPGLTRLCVALARAVAADVETFDHAWGQLQRYACQRGASLLPDAQWAELEDWIAVNLSAAVFEAEATGWADWLKDNHITRGRAP